jgi:hypothetical protein
MNKAFAQLSPGERRFVVVVTVIMFVVINVWLVWPHFSDFGDLQSRGQAAEVKLANYRGVIVKADSLRLELSKLEGEGAAVPPADQATEFYRNIAAQALQSGVQVLVNSRTMTRTNQFFLEQIQTITVQATEKQLVDFLYNLGTGNSLIRARSLSVHPDQSRQQLNATITLIASYQKNSKAQAAAAPAPRVPAAAPTNTGPRATPVNKPLPLVNPAAPKTGTQKKQ